MSVNCCNFLRFTCLFSILPQFSLALILLLLRVNGSTNVTITDTALEFMFLRFSTAIYCL